MFTKNTRFGLCLTVMLALVALGSACGGGEKEAKKEDKPGTPYKSKGDEGTITGKIAFAGAPSTPVPINTAADPVCASKNPNLQSEENVVKDGKLANVFVYIKDGTLADKTKISDVGFPTPTEAVSLDQKGCQYVPHVVGIQVKQVLRVTNSDPTQHNIHPTGNKNEEWNQTQPAGAAPIERAFTNAEVVVPVKCNQHPWMKSYIGVLKHPFFAVSAADGTFTIKGVPPGTYTIAAWHEGGGKGTEMTQKVTVGAKGNVTADFSFGGTASVAQPSSLQMMPAIEFPMMGHH